MEKKYKAAVFFLILTLLFTFLLKTSPFISSAKNVISDLLAEFPLKIVSLSLLPLDGIVSCNRSLRENYLLKKENQDLKIRLMQLQEAQAENERLHKLLSFRQVSPFSLITARVLAFDASNFRHSLIIDKGKKHKIKVGNCIINAEGIIGMVSEAGNVSSRVMLITDSDFSIAAKVKRSNAIGVISGSLEGTCRLKYLDLSDDVKVGDEVISAGKDSRFPEGIPIGVVVSISREHSGLTNFAVIEPAAKLSSIEEALVITNAS